MKKVADGFLYRIIRSVEFYGLLILTLVMCFILTYVIAFSGSEYLSMNEDRHVTISDFSYSKDQVSSMLFMNSNIPAKEVYGDLGASRGFTPAHQLILADELATVHGVMESMFTIPSLLTSVFVTLFLGRLFSDGTVRNIVSCGHRKRTIFSVCLLLVVAVSVISFLMAVTGSLLGCLFRGWHPPLYLPALLHHCLLEIIIVISYSVMVLSVLFTFGRRTVAIIAAFILVLANSLIIAPATVSLLATGEREIDTGSEAFAMFREASQNGMDATMEIDPLTLRPRFLIEGREIDLFTGPEIPFVPKGPARDILLGLSYLNPSLCYAEHICYITPTKTVILISCGTQLLLMIGVSVAGAFIFNRKELN